jgi:hypothetical protein
MMGRWFFSGLMVLVGLMYLWLAYMATIGDTQNTDLSSKALGFVLFVGIGAIAGVAAFSLLREKRP